jgi:hypothetical protein
MDDDTTPIDLPENECAIITSDDMEGMHFTFPNPEQQAFSGRSSRINGSTLW